MTPHDAPTDRGQAQREKIARALASDREAVQSLVAELTPVIQARAARCLLRRRQGAGGRDVREELRDLTQHVFLALFADDGRFLRDWSPDGGASLENFVGLIAERQILSLLRSRRRNPWTDVPTEAEEIEVRSPADPGPEIPTLSRDLLRRVIERAEVELSERGVEMLHWLVLEERAVEEVCALTGMKPEAVYAWRSRLGQRLRTIAAEIVSDPGSSPRTPRRSEMSS
jgi:RNA polymerase sigma-70 factor (ECF subfamily)